MARNPVLGLISIGLALIVSLSLCMPLEEFNSINSTTLSKRNSALYDLWNSISKKNIAGGNSARHFYINKDKSDAWGVTYLHGCSALLIADRTFIVGADGIAVAHLQEEKGSCISLQDQATVEGFLKNKLEPELDLSDPTSTTRVHFIHRADQGSSPGGTYNGIEAIQNYIKNKWQFANTVDRYGMSGGSGTGEPNPNSPNGLGVVQYIAGDDNPIGNVKVFFGSSSKGENPVSEDPF